MQPAGPKIAPKSSTGAAWGCSDRMRLSFPWRCHQASALNRYAYSIQQTKEQP